jgi:hypothetical protein
VPKPKRRKQTTRPHRRSSKQVVIAAKTLTKLAARIRAEHKATAIAMRRGVAHAIAAGELLIQAKTLLKHGRWLPWLRDHCEMSERTAQLYMRCARARKEIEANPQRVADLSLRGVANLLASPLLSMPRQRSS